MIDFLVKKIKRKEQVIILLSFCTALIFILSEYSFADTVSYSYDNLNRLTAVTHSNGTVINYTYDAAGNRLSKTVTVQVASDTVPPTGSILINGGDRYTNSTTLSLTHSAVDNAGPVTHMRFSDNGALWEPWTPYAPEAARTALNTNGTKTIYIMFRDAAGNTSIIYSDSITLDTVPPALTVNAIQSPTTASSTIITGTVETGTSIIVATDTTASDGIAALNGTSWSYTITNLAEGLNNVSVKATDNAGNVTEKVLTITRGANESQISDPFSLYLFYRFLKGR